MVTGPPWSTKCHLQGRLSLSPTAPPLKRINFLSAVPATAPVGSAAGAGSWQAPLRPEGSSRGPAARQGRPPAPVRQGREWEMLLPEGVPAGAGQSRRPSLSLFPFLFPPSIPEGSRPAAEGGRRGGSRRARTFPPQTPLGHPAALPYLPRARSRAATARRRRRAETWAGQGERPAGPLNPRRRRDYSSQRRQDCGGTTAGLQLPALPALRARARALPLAQARRGAGRR